MWLKWVQEGWNVPWNALYSMFPSVFHFFLASLRAASCSWVMKNVWRWRLAGSWRDRSWCTRRGWRWRQTKSSRSSRRRSGSEWTTANESWLLLWRKMCQLLLQVPYEGLAKYHHQNTSGEIHLPNLVLDVVIQILNDSLFHYMSTNLVTQFRIFFLRNRLSEKLLQAEAGSSREHADIKDILTLQALLSFHRNFLSMLIFRCGHSDNVTICSVMIFELDFLQEPQNPLLIIRSHNNINVFARCFLQRLIFLLTTQIHSHMQIRCRSGRYFRLKKLCLYCSVVASVHLRLSLYIIAALRPKSDLVNWYHVS